MNRLLRLTDTNFEEEVLFSGIPVLVEFWASWCPPCQMVEPILNELADEYEGRVKIAKLHVDQNPITSAKFKVVGIPTFAIFKEGDILIRKSGAHSKKQLLRMLVETLGL